MNKEKEREKGKGIFLKLKVLHMLITKIDAVSRNNLIKFIYKE